MVRHKATHRPHRVQGPGACLEHAHLWRLVAGPPREPSGPRTVPGSGRGSAVARMASEAELGYKEHG